jgi:transcriptional regulator with XRE-family HTH domain
MRDFNELDQELISRMPNITPTTDEKTMSEGFADIVFSYRVRNGLTQQQLADEAVVGVKTIHRIEGGSGGVKIDTVEKVLRALNIDWEEAVAFLAERKKKAQKSLVEV